MVAWLANPDTLQNLGAIGAAVIAMLAGAGAWLRVRRIERLPIEDFVLRVGQSLERTSEELRSELKRSLREVNDRLRECEEDRAKMWRRLARIGGRDDDV